ncbi:helix-turn-helix domain-containing protein [Guptibacillus algicola]|uniref:helix-turn-helix domain-containing protein n=1 Tax=Guptibacillus algicola TaxID=225844 RepID=UPI001CD4B9B8|nr:helix-turn-helix domain-containing protein [Alkalihalobacillus algicola]MCA0988932.1 helix-turn-helix domain-containing protein [Alkalihalobacillus algicola]
MESRLYNLLQRAKKQDEEAISLILQTFEKKIEAELRQTSYAERDDLRQDLYMKVYEAIEKYKIDDVPDFEEFVINLEKGKKDSGE